MNTEANELPTEKADAFKPSKENEKNIDRLSRLGRREFNKWAGKEAARMGFSVDELVEAVTKRKEARHKGNGQDVSAEQEHTTGVPEPSTIIEEQTVPETRDARHDKFGQMSEFETTKVNGKDESEHPLAEFIEQPIPVVVEANEEPKGNGEEAQEPVAAMEEVKEPKVLRPSKKHTKKGKGKAAVDAETGGGSDVLAKAKEPEETYTAAVTRLSWLTSIEYDSGCKTAAKKLGCSINTLKADVKKERAKRSVTAQDKQPEGFGWRSELLGKLITRKEDGQEVSVLVPICMTANIITILNNDVEFAGRIKYNEFDQVVYIDGLVISDTAVINIKTPLERKWFCTSVQKHLVYEAIDVVAKINKYHPVHDYFNSLTWDGTKRIDAFLSETVGCPLDDYHSEVSKKFFLTVVARIFNPGCAVRFCLMLIDPKQAAGKSLLFQTLCPYKDWFSDDFTLSDMSSKVGGIKLHGRILVEISELASGYKGKQTEEIKAFMTRTDDKFIPPYGRNTVTYPRQTMLCGSTNNATALVDPSGGTRFHPVTVSTSIDLAKALENRDQLWAEAVARYKSGESYTIDPDLYDVCAEHQLAATQEDAWTEDLTEKIEDIDGKLTSTGIAKDILFLPADHRNNGAFARIDSVMNRLGYTNKFSREFGRKWHKPDAITLPDEEPKKY